MAKLVAMATGEYIDPNAVESIMIERMATIPAARVNMLSGDNFDLGPIPNANETAQQIVQRVALLINQNRT